jgi:hypothetical protein
MANGNTATSQAQPSAQSTGALTDINSTLQNIAKNISQLIAAIQAVTADI